MGIRETRLQAEYEGMTNFASDVMRWETFGNSRPSDSYRLFYNLRSIVGFDGPDKPIFEHREWVIEIVLPHNYPFAKPNVYFADKTIFHPNVYNTKHICIDDEWKISFTLDTLCEHIGQMIAFQKYNLGSPANNDTQLRQWITGPGQTVLPTDPRDIRRARISFGSTSMAPPKPQSGRIKFGR
jgi:ubiquitin-protein ligase